MAIDEEAEITCLVGALLHDIGHGPFSHVFERVSGIHHERLGQRLIMDPGSEVHQLLFQFDKIMPERVLHFLQCKPKRTFYCDILSSQLDADRLDYLLRDNLNTGSRYGDYDLNWLLHAFVVDTASDRLAISHKGISAVEAYLQARYHMYRNVYFHKVVRSAEGMVKLALQRAKRLAVQERLEWPPREGAVHKALLGQRFTVNEFRGLDDVSVWHCFKLWADSPDPILASLCRGLLYRRLYSAIDITRLDPHAAKQAFARAEAAVAAAGGEPAYDLFLDEPADTPYETHDPKSEEPSEEIMVLDPVSGSRRFGDVSPITQSLNRELMFRRIHVRRQWKETVLDAVSGSAKQ